MTGRIRDAKGAAARLQTAGLLLESARCSIPNLAELVAGGPIKGSWWGHARGRDIFRILGGLLDRDDVLCCRLILGKGTLVHRRLWPALHRVQEDWGRDVVKEAHTSQFRELADALAERGELRLDSFMQEVGAGSKAERRGYAEARIGLEKTLTVVSEDRHTEKGEHTTVLRRWSDRMPRGIEKKAGALGWVGAVDELVGTAVCAARSAPEREVLGWFPWPVTETTSSLERLRQGRVLRIEDWKRRGLAVEGTRIVAVRERYADRDVK